MKESRVKAKQQVNGTDIHMQIDNDISSKRIIFSDFLPRNRNIGDLQTRTLISVGDFYHSLPW